MIKFINIWTVFPSEHFGNSVPMETLFYNLVHSPQISTVAGNTLGAVFWWEHCYSQSAPICFFHTQLLHSGPMLPRGRPAARTIPQHHTLPPHMPQRQSHSLSPLSPLSQHGFCPMRDGRALGQVPPPSSCSCSSLPGQMGGVSSQG